MEAGDPMTQSEDNVLVPQPLGNTGHAAAAWGKEDVSDGGNGGRVESTIVCNGGNCVRV